MIFGKIREALGPKRERPSKLWRAKEIGMGLLENKVLGKIPLVGGLFKLHGAYRVGRGLLAKER